MSEPTNICSACNKEPSVVTWGPHTLCPACAAKFMATMHAKNQEALTEMGEERKAKVRAEARADSLEAQLIQAEQEVMGCQNAQDVATGAIRTQEIKYEDMLKAADARAERLAAALRVSGADPMGCSVEHCLGNAVQEERFGIEQLGQMWRRRAAVAGTLQPGDLGEP